MAYSDSFQLSINGSFQNRVAMSLGRACINVGTESMSTIPFHRERQSYAAGVLNNLTFYTTLFANVVATDVTVLADVAASTPLTSTNSSTAQLSVTDAHIDNSIAATFNSFIKEPGV